ncbi:MFS transporter [Calidifontibacter sp. DB0510]|uniref:MFS transporter n=1 Tax=Metallococcus carri TaxID=1656884 RepID=A0A967EAP2_9MICO|nr:MFS transporter [Metallococcus carri]NHN56104.1 MFS transporter [Metallococcus carri]NOP37439.1 MFS transporter [Calidifontibacter sp. DB2511S]
MTPRHDAALMLGSGFVEDFGFRLAQVAIPLVVLAQTRSVAMAGIVGGVAGIPSLLAPWWTRRARQWVNSGHRVALVRACMAVGLGLLPLLAVLDRMNPATLVAADLVIGIFEALAIPGAAALIAEVGDRIGPEHAVTLLTWQDGLRRVAMLVGPGVGAVAVGFGSGVTVLAVVAVVQVGAAMAVWPVPGTAVPDDEPQEHPTIRASLRGRTDVARGWVMRGMSCATWFAFSLGLAVRGVELGRPGVLYAWGMTGYGLGSLIATALAPRIVPRCPTRALARFAWSVGGLAWVGMALWDSEIGIATSAALGGATLVLGIAAVNRAITTTSAGATRRTLMGGQATIVNATASLGMLAGGPILATLGFRTTLVAAGLLTTATALVAGRHTGNPVSADRQHSTCGYADAGATDGRVSADRQHSTCGYADAGATDGRVSADRQHSTCGYADAAGARVPLCGHGQDL